MDRKNPTDLAVWYCGREKRREKTLSDWSTRFSADEEDFEGYEALIRDRTAFRSDCFCCRRICIDAALVVSSVVMDVSWIDVSILVPLLVLFDSILRLISWALLHLIINGGG